MRKAARARWKKPRCGVSGLDAHAESRETGSSRPSTGWRLRGTQLRSVEQSWPRTAMFSRAWVADVAAGAGVRRRGHRPVLFRGADSRTPVKAVRTGSGKPLGAPAEVGRACGGAAGHLQKYEPADRRTSLLVPTAVPEVPASPGTRRSTGGKPHDGARRPAELPREACGAKSSRGYV